MLSDLSSAIPLSCQALAGLDPTRVSFHINLTSCFGLLPDKAVLSTCNPCMFTFEPEAAVAFKLTKADPKLATPPADENNAVVFEKSTESPLNVILPFTS